MEKFQIVLAFVLTLLVVGCDPGTEMLEKCQEAVGGLPTELPEEELRLETAPWETALRKCQMLANSDSGLASKGAEIIKEVEARKTGFEKTLLARHEERELAEKKEKAAKEAGARREIDSCKSKQWVSACENNGVPQGGAFYSDSPDKCEESAQGFREAFGLKCVKCGCSDEMVTVLSGRVY